MTKYHQNDDVGWDRGREGYLDLPQKPVYAPVAEACPEAQGTRDLSSALRTEERLGSLIAAGGMIWGAYAATSRLSLAF